MAKVEIQSPVVVVGVPRSGTSFVAECLMKHYDVRMCLHGFTTENDYILDDRETYEDSTVVDLNIALSEQRINFEQYKERMSEYFEAMGEIGGVWGFKDPRIYETLRWVIEYFDGKLTVIRTERDVGKVIESMKQVLGWTERKALEEYNKRNVKIQSALRYKNLNVLECRFGKKIRTEEEFCNTFETSLKKKHEREALALEFYKKKLERRSVLSGS